MVQEEKIHISAAVLTVAAAGKSGLLREVAEALCSFDRLQSIPCCCDGPHALCDALADAFDDHICTPGIVMESYFGEGFVPSFNDTELAPYLKVE
jgi:hypothetical protein